MIASLPMYDRPETAALNDRLWAGLRAQLGPEAPARLTRGGSLWDQWCAPDLCLSQTCGYPYRTRLHGRVTLLGAPVWDLPCPPGQYFSVMVVRANDSRRDLTDFATATFAYNEALSQSGWAAPQTFAATQGFHFARLLHSGSHRASARAVAEGRAGIAALDAVSWQLIRRFDRFADRLRVLIQTPPTPTLPYITAPGQDAPALRRALAAAIDGMAPADKAVLGLRGFVEMAPEAYLAVLNPPDPQAIAPPQP